MFASVGSSKTILLVSEVSFILPVQHLVLSFCNVADVVCHVPQIDNCRAHLQTYHSHPKKHLTNDHGHPDDAHLIHVLLHLLLTGVLLSRLTRRCNEAVIWIQALMDCNRAVNCQRSQES